ncbi:citrate transporter, partial [Bifidobacterium pullorum subsp. saeculare]|nr:citrate transporter [Bifidobacterium pullorum subsp. saeculare]
MLIFLAFAMIVSFIVLLSMKKLSVFNALTLVPLVFGVIAVFATGATMSDLFSWIKDGIFYTVDYEGQSTSMGVISPGLTILFSVLYFDLMLGVGLFDPVAAFFIKMAKG